MAKKVQRIPKLTMSSLSATKKKSKYSNKKTVVNREKFDSLAESRYYLVLLDRKKKKEICDFELQPVFELQPSFKKNGETFRAIKYKADFKVIHNDGRIEIVDVKGMKTEVFKIKQKLFEYKYPELSLRLVEM